MFCQILMPWLKGWHVFLKMWTAVREENGRLTQQRQIHCCLELAFFLTSRICNISLCIKSFTVHFH